MKKLFFNRRLFGSALLLLSVFLALTAIVVLCVMQNPAHRQVPASVLRPLILSAARKHNLEPELVEAVIWRESNFYQFKVGGSGEIGLMQIMPKAAVVDWSRAVKRSKPADWELFDLKLNLDIGCWYLSLCVSKYPDYRCRRELGLARYNAGVARVNKWLPKDKKGDVTGLITFPTTKNYVRKVMSRYRANVKKKLFR